MLEGLLSRRVLFVMGKGGAGTTTVSAALAWSAAKSTNRVLAMECDGRAPMAAALRAKGQYEPQMVSERLYVMVLEGRRALEEYLRLVIPARTVLRAVFASRLYQFFVQAAPGLRELMMLGKVCYEAGRTLGGGNQWDLIVVDAPASGQALSLLRMPSAARKTFGESIVGHEADNIDRMLHDPRSLAVILVTTPEPLVVAETVETFEALDAIGITPATIILNRSASAPFSPRDLTRLREHLISGGNSSGADSLVKIARRQLDHSARAKQALQQLAHRTGVPVVQLPELHGLSGRALVDRLGDELSDELERAASFWATGAT
jgi:anion-transporting  ArsA/GET3 family ATPase